MQAKQNGELDPQAVSVAFAAILTPVGRPGFAASRAAQGVGDGADNASAQLGIRSARGQPRVDSLRLLKTSGHGMAANPSG